MFKNTFKIAPAESKMKDKYFNLINKCKLNIFEFKDKNGEGIEHKYISNPALFDYYDDSKIGTLNEDDDVPEVKEYLDNKKAD